MTKTFAEFLNEIGSDRDTLHQALTLHVSERSGDLTPAEMLEQMKAASTDPAAIAAAVASWAADGENLENAALAYFDEVWREQPGSPEIAAVFAGANTQLPIVESTVIAIAAMYAMYLLATGGVTKEEIRTIRGADGSFSEVKRVERSPWDHRETGG